MGQGVMGSASFTNTVLTPYLSWLTNNPTKRPQYIVYFYGLPGRIEDGSTVFWSPSYYLHTAAPGMKPFVTCINLRTTNDCAAYIDKLRFVGTKYSPGKLIISASAGGYGNTNYYFDDTGPVLGGTAGLIGFAAVIQNGASTNSVTYTNVTPECGSLACHIAAGTNVTGYLCWGAHSSLGNGYATNGYVSWAGNSTWWIIETIESFNGQRDNPSTGQGNFLQWFSANAFGGTNYSNTPVGAVSHVEEPGNAWNDPDSYFGRWQAGSSFAVCAWDSRRTVYFQAVGDPFVKK